jgi:hypothetical protein
MISVVFLLLGVRLGVRVVLGCTIPSTQLDIAGNSSLAIMYEFPVGL